MAEAHKINYKKISNNKNLKSNLKKALLGNKPIICELMLDHNQEQMPKLLPVPRSLAPYLIRHRWVL